MLLLLTVQRALPADWGLEQLAQRQMQVDLVQHWTGQKARERLQMMAQLDLLLQQVVQMTMEQSQRMGQPGQMQAVFVQTVLALTAQMLVQLVQMMTQASRRRVQAVPKGQLWVLKSLMALHLVPQKLHQAMQLFKLPQVRCWQKVRGRVRHNLSTQEGG